jgi:hypothetical protein
MKKQHEAVEIRDHSTSKTQQFVKFKTNKIFNFKIIKYLIINIFL